MIKIKELEEYFEESFEEILNNDRVVYIANNIDNAFKDYFELENDLEYIKSIEKDFKIWVKNVNAKELLDYDLDTYQRHFLLEDGNVYYLNDYI